MQVADHRWEYAKAAGEPVGVAVWFCCQQARSGCGMVREMPDGYRYVIPDLFGFGNSSHLPDADYDVASRARLHGDRPGPVFTWIGN